MSEHAGKRYVVTGAASGIGDAVARQLIDAGAEVHSLDRNEPAAAVTGHIKVDLASPDSIDEALARLDGFYDALINVAGVPGTAPADVVFAVNTLAPRHLTESFLDRLNPGGSVVIVSSTAGWAWAERLPQIMEVLATDTYADGARWFAEHPQEGNAYNFSKECTTVYTMTMGMALNEMGFRINAILPGPVDTPILGDFEESMGKDNLDAVKELLGRHATPEDIAGATVFLVSDAARWINGHPLIVDGGISGAVLAGLVPPPDI